MRYPFEYKKLKNMFASQTSIAVPDVNQSFAETLPISSIHVSSIVFPSMEDDVVEHIDSLSNSFSTENVDGYASYNTCSLDVNKINQEDLEYFRTWSQEIITSITQIDFEDGIENYITELVKEFICKNKFVAYNWLNEIYSCNITNIGLIEGLLRTISLVTEKGDEAILLPIVISGLRSNNISEQEAAIMVVEEWRTKECLEALQISSFDSKMVENYAIKVMEELKKELCY